MKAAALFLILALILGWVWWSMFGRPLLDQRRRRRQMWLDMQAWDDTVRNFNKEPK